MIESSARSFTHQAKDGCRRNRRDEGMYLRPRWITPSKKTSDDIKILRYLALFNNSLSVQYFFFCQQSYVIHILQCNLWQVQNTIVFGQWVFFFLNFHFHFHLFCLFGFLRSLFQRELGRLYKMIEADRNTKSQLRSGLSGVSRNVTWAGSEEGRLFSQAKLD